MNGVHDTFHVSNLKNYFPDPKLQVPLDEIQVNAKLNFMDELVEILEKEFKKLKRSRISIVKIAMSSTEAEYIAAAEASMEAVWMRKFIDGLGDGARHFQRKYHYIRKVIQEGETVLKKVHTDDNVADLFTKPMSFNKHFEHAMAIEIVPAGSLM
ncbi:hypothetical protein Tco_0154440 [Tanacetum coccineum]